MAGRTFKHRVKRVQWQKRVNVVSCVVLWASFSTSADKSTTLTLLGVCFPLGTTTHAKNVL